MGINSICINNKYGVDFTAKDLTAKDFTAKGITARGDKLKILLVEDDLVCQRIIDAVCKILGWHLVVAGNPKDAIEIFTNEKFDIVLMDFVLPDINGLQLSIMLRDIERKDNKYTPIIICTAYAADNLKEDCFKAGIDDFILKPFVIEDLVLVCDRHQTY